MAAIVLCSNCDQKPVIARGLCQACYYRLRRNGSVVRRNVQNRGMTCRFRGCEEPAHAKGFCLHHYEQQRHPLNHSWRLLRSRWPGEYPATWGRFDAFLADVGERPSPKHQLRRVDTKQPWSSTNVHWNVPIGVNRDTRSPEVRSEYQRAHHLRRKFGLSTEDYAKMLHQQGGVCAICAQPETHRYPSGKLKDLSVDHDHQTRMVRGLLCVNCNRGLGYFDDNPERLRAAAAYVQRRGLKGVA